MLYLEKKNRCLYEIHRNSYTLIYAPTIWMDSYVAKYPTILDRFFTGVVNTTSTPMGGRMGRAGSHEVAG